MRRQRQLTTEEVAAWIAALGIIVICTIIAAAAIPLDAPAWLP